MGNCRRKVRRVQPKRRVSLFSPAAGGFSQPVHRIFHRFSNFLLLFHRFSTSGVFRRICSFRSLFSSRQSDFHGSMLLSSPVFEKFRSVSVSEKSVSFFKPLCRYRLSVFYRHFRFSTPPRLFHRLVAKFSQTPRLYTQKPYFQRFSRGV